MAFYVAGGGGVFCGGVAIESIGSEARAPGDRNSVFLFLYEAIHELVASVSGIRAGDFTGGGVDRRYRRARLDRKSTRLNSSHTVISYAVFCLKKKNDITDVLTRHRHY